VVSAREIIERAQRRGAQFEVIGEKLRATPASAIDAALRDEIGRHKAEVIGELLRREHDHARASTTSTTSRSDTLEAARVLPEPRWPPTEEVCDFLIGHAGERCLRCGASWHEHYPR